MGEIVPDGWELTSSVCSDGSDPSAISLSPAETVTCVFTNTFVPPPGEFRCRTPGFWGTHACPGNPESCEKSKSQNITGALIDSAGGLTVCGQPIDNTLVDWQNSALEAICMHPRGVIEHQLVRQLTALALNCELSGFGADCSLNPALGALFASCDAICQGGGDLSGCISDIDCSNNGGSLFGGVCVFGECSETGELCGFDLTLDCPYVDDGLVGNLNDCTAFDDNCHDRSLCPDLDDDGVVNGSDFCFEPPGPAGSPKACNQARRSDCTVLFADCAVNNNG